MNQTNNHKTGYLSGARKLFLGFNTISVMLLSAIIFLMSHAPQREYREQTTKVADKTWISMEDGVLHQYKFFKNGKVEHRHGDVLVYGRWNWVSVNEMSITLKEQYQGEKRATLADSEKRYYIRYTKIHEAELILAEGMLETEFETGFSDFISYKPTIENNSLETTAQLSAGK